jgi:hypothetical protein
VPDPGAKFHKNGVRGALDLQVAENAGGLPQAVQRHQRHDRRPDEKQQVRRALGVAAFHQVAEEPAQNQGRDPGKRAEDVYRRADLSGHEVLLADRRGQSVLRAGDEQEGGPQQQVGHQKRLIGDRREGEQQVHGRAQAAEQHHEAPVPHAEGVPGVARKSEQE